MQISHIHKLSRGTCLYTIQALFPHSSPDSKPQHDSLLNNIFHFKHT